MRRLLAFTIIVVLTGAMFASAALLEVDGGTIQGFRMEAEVEAPGTTACEVDDECVAAETASTSTSSTSGERDVQATTTSESTTTSASSTTSSEATETTSTPRLAPTTTQPG